MGMDKKILREFADPGLKFSPGNGLLHTDKIKYIARTTIKNIAGRRTLLLYLYDCKSAAEGNNTPKYTIFQCRDDYITLELTADGSEKWRSACLWNLNEGHNSILSYGNAFYSAKDETRVKSFCGRPGYSGIDALNYLQSNIMRKRLTERIKVRERKTLQCMKSLKPLPRDLKGWVHRDVLPAYIYYEYRKTKKPLAGYCTACRRDVSVVGAKHNEKGACPHCGKQITFKATGKMSKHFSDRDTAQVIEQINPDELVIRVIKILKYYCDYRNPNISIWETARIFIRCEDGKKVLFEPFYYSYSRGILTNWQKGFRPEMNTWAENFDADLCGHLYHRNLDIALSGTPWQYSQLKQFSISINEKLEVLPYLRAYIKYPAIEYLYKLGLVNLLCDVVYVNYSPENIISKGNNLREILGVETKDIPLLQKLNADAWQLELVRNLRKQNVCFDAEIFYWCKAQNIKSIREILYALRFMTIPKLLHYVEQQYKRKNQKKGYNWSYLQILMEYRDYLEAAQALEYDMTDSFILFPRNLKDAHDRVNELNNKRKVAIYNVAIEQAFQELLYRYGFDGDGFTIIPPKSAEELVHEGHKLHHCVGGYASRVAAGESIILFLRKTEAINEPFCTIELHNGAIYQTRVSKNNIPDTEVQNFLNLWDRKVLKKQRGLQAA